MKNDVSEQPLDAAGYAAFTDSFAVRDDETVAGTIDDFDKVRAQLLATWPGPIRPATSWRLLPYQPDPGTLLA